MATPLLIAFGVLGAGFGGRFAMQRLAARAGKTGMDAWVKGGFQSKMDPKEAKQILGIRFVVGGSPWRRTLPSLGRQACRCCPPRSSLWLGRRWRRPLCRRWFTKLTSNFARLFQRDPVTVKKIKDAHRRIMIVNHPDRGGVRSPRCCRLACAAHVS